MGTKPEHLQLPENASHEGWRKGRQPGAGRQQLPRTRGPWAGGHGVQGTGEEEDHGLGEMRVSRAMEEAGRRGQGYLWGGGGGEEGVRNRAMGWGGGGDDG